MAKHKLAVDQMLTMLLQEGWQQEAPTAQQWLAYPGTWHVKNPGDPETYGCRPATIPDVLKPGGVCRPYARPVSAEETRQRVASAAEQLVAGVDRLQTFHGLVARDDVAALIEAAFGRKTAAAPEEQAIGEES